LTGCGFWSHDSSLSAFSRSFSSLEVAVSASAAPVGAFGSGAGTPSRPNLPNE
jgi:hypothetical protein